MATILLVDDERGIHEVFEDAMESGRRVLHAMDGMEALQLLEGEEVDLIVTDLTMPNLDGMALLREVRERGVRVPALVLSAHGSVPNVVEALRLGAHDFIEKPAGTDRLRMAVASALRSGERDRERRELEERAGVAPAFLRTMVGSSPAMRELVEQVALVAGKRARVLVLGENGTGKELVARALHEGSDRAEGPFVRVNCAAIPETLFESELFGHEKGAFTGAVANRAGRFERADGGTLFLDEVGELPLSMQPKLLRAIEAGEVERVGGGGTRTVDVRVVAATNRDLARMVEDGAFREDLYYRLNVVQLRVPSLRERRDDVPELARHFLEWACREENLPLRQLEPEAEDELRSHAWPGNVRELRNVIERLVIFSPSARLGAAQVRRALPGAGPEAGAGPGLIDSELPLKDLVAESERQAIQRRLERFEGNKTRAAESLGLERSHLYKKMKALGLDGPEES
jgi:two-component system nitrogen regulation response regulator NtrX